MSNRYLKAVLDLWASRGERTACTVEGDCMAPLIRPGDAVVIAHGRRNVRPGDVVVCRTREGFRVQRVVQLEGRGRDRSAIVKGDQTHTCLPPVPLADVLGTVVEVRGPGRRVRLDGPRARVLNRLMAGWLRLSLRRPRTAARLRRLTLRLAALGRPLRDTSRLRSALDQAYRRAGETR